MRPYTDHRSPLAQQFVFPFNFNPAFFAFVLSRKITYKARLPVRQDAGGDRFLRGAPKGDRRGGGSGDRPHDPGGRRHRMGAPIDDDRM